MKSPIPDYLEEVLETVRLDQSGELASYIPQLATADPDRLAAVFATLDGQVYGVGDVDHQFSIQSIPSLSLLCMRSRWRTVVLMTCFSRWMWSRQVRRLTSCRWREIRADLAIR